MLFLLEHDGFFNKTYFFPFTEGGTLILMTPLPRRKLKVQEHTTAAQTIILRNFTTTSLIHCSTESGQKGPVN